MVEDSPDLANISNKMSDIEDFLTKNHIWHQTRNRFGEKTILITKNGLKDTKLSSEDVKRLILENFGKNNEISFVEGKSGFFIRVKRNNVIEGGYSDPFNRETIQKSITDAGLDGEEQVRLGIGVEMEHTSDELLAEEIALDHLLENPRYY